MKLLPKIKDNGIRLLLTDIPYGVVNRNDNGLRNLDKGKADITTFNLMEFCEAIYPKADIFAIFCAKEQLSELCSYFNAKSSLGEGSTRQLVWSKTNPSPMNGEYVYLSSIENCVWFKKKGSGKLNRKCAKAVIEAPTGSSKYHPTEKNHKLLEQIILDNTNEEDWVLDCCMGSGSTGIVCKKLNRNFIGIELDEKYFKIAEERINNA